MTTDQHPGELTGLYLDKARIAETLHSYGIGCDEKDRDGLLGVFTDDAKAMYDGATWLEGGPTIVEWLLGALGGLSYSQHMLTAPRITVDGTSAASVGYLNSHQIAAADAATLIHMNARYDCDLQLVDGRWRISQLVLAVGWFETRSAAAAVGESPE